MVTLLHEVKMQTHGSVRHGMLPIHMHLQLLLQKQLL